ncbi:MAG TPA: 4-alpha-glucanotransferase [Polyangiaceae bacterium]|jgi:4-alpha-glucanotransferase
MSVPTLRQRASGVLLHPTSLPGPHGSGDLGVPARAFVDFLARAGQRWWQMLPVAPPGYGESPYSAQSAFAGSPLLVSLEGLAGEGLLRPGEIAPDAPLAANRVDHPPTEAHRMRRLRAAFDAFEGRAPAEEKKDLAAYAEENRAWLEDWALFDALKRAHGGVQWTRWAPALRSREPRALATARTEHAREMAFARFVQWAFDRQWRALRGYAQARGVGLIGDVPIFVAHDSADVWQQPDAFFLDGAGEPTVISGCPPDYFSATGQRWGNPLYRWRRMRKTGYRWWIDRLRTTLRRFDAVRLDHFIGFQRYWEIPATEPTAVRGRWMKGPGADFFDAVKAALGELPLIAEDLGETTPAVYALRDRYRLPGIKILQFAFGADPQGPSFRPHNYPRRAVVYTGTHDNDTTVGWFLDPGGDDTTRTPAMVDRERSAALTYLGTTGEEIHWDMIRTALASVARLALFPMQDLLGLGSEARMNRPGKPSGNWSWRFAEGAATERIADRLAGLTRAYERGAA